MRKGSLRASRPARLRALGSRAPKFRFGFATPFAREHERRRVLPLRRSWVAIGVVAVLFALLCLPLFSVGAQLGTHRDGDLFSLVFTLFHGFWLLGWSVGVITVGLVLIALLLAREVLLIRRDGLTLRLEVLGLGIAGEYDATKMRNLRTAAADAAAGTSWRGPHLAFDYLGVPVEFGSNLDGPHADALLNRVRAVLEMEIPDGAAPVEALATAGIQSDAPAPTRDPVPGGPPAGVREPPPDAQSRGTGAGNARPVTPPSHAAAVAWHSPSTIALIAANVLPLGGVALFGWSMGEIMLLYWAESAIVGMFNVLKMAVIGRWSILFMGPFFIGHYGGFMAGHLLFIYGFFLRDPRASGSVATSAVLDDLARLWPALLALIVSHAISYGLNFLGRAEYVGRTARAQMGEPYKRIVVMHVTIIFGGFLALLLGSPLPALLLLVILKIAADTRAHLREHGVVPVRDGVRTGG